MKNICLFVVLCFAVSAQISHAAVTGKAKGTPLKEPTNPASVATCLNCHDTVKMLYNRGAHAKVNCAMCHESKPEHSTSPSAQNRPAVRTDHRACATCHEKQLESMLDMSYHMKWAERKTIPTYNSFPNSKSNFFQLVHSRTPRFHAGLLADITVNRTAGRFKYKNPYDVGRPIERLWDSVYDAHPEDGDTAGFVPRERTLAWRPQKSIGIIGTASCLKCKSADNILDYAYLGAPVKGAPLQRDSKVMPALKQLNTSVNCIFCHDPHSAEPRVVNDMLIEAMVEPEYKDNLYQSNPEIMPKAEVVAMGARGYERKIVILDRYDSNFMCGQCHSAPNASLFIYDAKTEKPILGHIPGNPYTTAFKGGPLETYAHYKEKGWYGAAHPVTKTKWIPFTHAQVELISQSVHSKAGVTCTSCHYARERGYSSHQVSLPREKVDKTCMSSNCHGQGTTANWKSTAQALYSIDLIQQKSRVRVKELNNAINNAVDFISDVSKGIFAVDPQLLAAVDDKLGQALTVDFYWFTEYSLGFHNPALHESSVTTAVKELNDALSAAQNKASVTRK
ncbi:MAG: ammonia-forming cytochrome c nitrite reductase subunit c552 [Burkholderiales bacterium]|jgi:formate-dependent nitrite reductase cytochrome c552 subunit|nr:ammonia-forming cytochrome c nitrite reductase subunit c552 [Burkholderiales bacterium]